MAQFLYLRTDICSQEITAGGSVGHTLGVLDGFIECGYSPVVFSSAIQTKLINKQKITFHSLKILPFFMLRWKFNYLRWRLECLFSTFFFALQILFFSSRCAFVYQRYSILNFSGLLISWVRSIPLILEYNGSEAYWFEVARSDVWYEKHFSFKKLSHAIERLNVSKADTIVAVSQALKDDLVSSGVSPEKILVNPNGVDAYVFDSQQFEKERMNIQKIYNLESKFVFGFIGTFGFWHGINILEEIIPVIVSKNRNAHFLLIGDGILKEKIEKKFQELGLLGSVTFTGKIDQDKAPEYLAACDAFLCPTQPNADGTRFFGSPTKLFEYMSMAKPIIASDLEQLSEVVSPAIKIKNISQNVHFPVTDQVGFLVDPQDVQGFVEGCMQCFSMPEVDRIKMGTNARQKVLAQYTWQQHVQRIIDHAGL